MNTKNVVKWSAAYAALALGLTIGVELGAGELMAWLASLITFGALLANGDKMLANINTLVG